MHCYISLSDFDRAVEALMCLNALSSCDNCNMCSAPSAALTTLMKLKVPMHKTHHVCVK